MENELNTGADAPAIYGPYQSGCSVIIIANSVIGEVKILEVGEDNSDTGLVLGIVPEGEVSQTSVILTEGKFRLALTEGASIGKFHVQRPSGFFKVAPALALQGGGLPVMDGQPFAYTNQYGELQPIKAYDAFYGGEIIEEFSDSVKRMTTNLTAGKYKLVIESIAVSECGSGTSWFPVGGEFTAPLPTSFNVTELSLKYIGDYTTAYTGSLLLDSGVQNFQCKVHYIGSGGNAFYCVDFLKGECIFSVMNTVQLSDLIASIAVSNESGTVGPIYGGYGDSYFVAYKLIKL